MLSILIYAAQTALLWLVLALLLSFYSWLTHPWRCDLYFNIFWTHPEGEVPHYRLVWVGWLVFAQETSKGWRGWSVRLYTD